MGVRAIFFSGLMTFVVTGFAAAQTAQRPPVGGFGSSPDAMIFYVAQGAPGACGQGCSEWIAAEGAVQRDTRVEPELLDIVDRNSESRRPTELPPSEWTRLRIVTASPL